MLIFEDLLQLNPLLEKKENGMPLVHMHYQ